MKFSSKLTLFFSAMGVLFLGAVSYIGYVSNIDIFEHHIRESLEYYAFHTMDKIDRLLYEKYVQVQIIANDPVLSSRESTQNQLTQRLRKMKNPDPSYADLSLYTMERKLLADTAGKPVGEEHPVTEYWQRIQSGDTVVVGIHLSHTLHESVMYFASAVKGEGEQKPFAVVVVRVFLDAIYDIAKDAAGTHDFGERIDVDLVNDKGLILYSNHNPEEILKKTTPSWQSIDPLLLSGKRLGSKLVRTVEGKGDDIFAFAREEGYKEFKGNNWTVILTLPARTAFAPVAELRNTMIAIALIFGLAAVVFIYFFSRSITMPLKVLSKGLLEIGKGNLDVRINLSSKDEIGGMAVSFNEMAKELKESRDKLTDYSNVLKHSNDELENKAQELRKRDAQSRVLGTMGELLHACSTVEEAGKVIAGTVVRLLPGDSGCLSMYSASRNLVEAIVVWGDNPPKEQVFSPQECWGLRRGRSHVMTDTGADVPCPHVKESLTPYLCIPLVAQGEALGLLHLQAVSLDTNGGEREKEMKRKENILLRITENAALAIANLKLRETMQGLSIRDPLTGLFNRRYMQETLEIEKHRALRKGDSIGIIMLDIDHFKQFNDTFGHDAGDKVLCELGAFIRQHIRKSDIPCRYGGEEFTIILPETALATACQRANHLKEAVKHLGITHNRQSLGTISVSMGVAVLPDHGTEVEEVLKAADDALYRAKHEGRDCVCLAKGEAQNMSE